MEVFDVLVVGGGPGGYLCAERASEKGLRCALFEKRSLGGTCLNEGCIPTKSLLNAAKLYRHATESEPFGVRTTGVTIDHGAVIDRKNKVVKTLVGGVEAAMKANKVTVVRGEAVLAGKDGQGFLVKSGNETYAGKHLVIASGSETTIPPVPGLREGLQSGFVVTNREILDDKNMPKRMAVIGGGVIGLEMAFYFASVGVAVTVIEMMPKIAGNTDADACDLLTEKCVRRGMTFKLSCKVLEIKKNSVVFEENGKKQELKCDRVLLSAGRRPATGGLGLETLSLETERGAIVTDRHLCTNVSGVYAIGDCNGRLMLAHTAYREAEVCVNHITGVPDEMRYDAVPAVIYTDPEVASAGMSAQEAKEQGYDVKEIRLPMIYAGRYVAENTETDGFIKLVADKKDGRLLGCVLAGPYASELIVTPAMMIETRLPVSRLQKMVFAHPTVAEIIREALFRL